MSGSSDGRGLVYLDASALVKLVIEEPERDALVRHVAGRPRVSSELAVVELVRAVRRRAPGSDAETESLIRFTSLHRLDRRLMAEAAALLPSSLGSLDAIHLATALRLRSALGAFVTYDRALGRAATAAGLPLAMPS